jgi:hypothetical protein
VPVSTKVTNDKYQVANYTRERPFPGLGERPGFIGKVGISDSRLYMPLSFYEGFAYNKGKGISHIIKHVEKATKRG